ncbi:MAG: hypothetical protein U5Q44_08050 [Dehalococcoidia bacterium]|nr:hypothetical protein [Dehalococcoidia bacterium]
MPAASSEDDVGHELARRQRTTLELGAQERGEQVIALEALLAALLHEPFHVVVPGVDVLAGRLAVVLTLLLVLGVRSADQDLGPVEDLIPVFAGDIGHLADRGDGELRRAVVDEIGGFASALAEAVGQHAPETGDVVPRHVVEMLFDGGHSARREVLADEGAVFAVLRRVHEDEVAWLVFLGPVTLVFVVLAFEVLVVRAHLGEPEPLHV